jgi:hypothetical protein
MMVVMPPQVTDSYQEQYIKRNPSVAEVDTTPHM